MLIKLLIIPIIAVSPTDNIFKDVLQRCLWVLPLREWVGYWQGNHRLGEIIGMDAFSPQEISKEYTMRLNEMAQDEFFSLVT